MTNFQEGDRVRMESHRGYLLPLREGTVVGFDQTPNGQRVRVKWEPHGNLFPADPTHLTKLTEEDA